VRLVVFANRRPSLHVAAICCTQLSNAATTANDTSNADNGQNAAASQLASTLGEDSSACSDTEEAFDEDDCAAALSTYTTDGYCGSGAKASDATPGRIAAETTRVTTAATTGASKAVAMTPGKALAMTPGRAVAMTPGKAVAMTPGKAVGVTTAASKGVATTAGSRGVAKAGSRATAHEPLEKPI